MKALISVSDKTGIVDFAKELETLGIQIISTGGTYKKLKESGVNAIEISELTGFPECLDGRVKTLHPKVHAGILAMRSKEDAQDYRYFPEPDLVPIEVSDQWLQEIRDRQPELRDQKCRRYVDEFGLPEYDAQILTSAKKLADLFEEAVKLCDKPKKVSNWLMGETMRLLKEHNMDPEDITFSPVNLAKLIALADAGTINGTVAKEVFEQIFVKDIDPDQYVEQKGLKTVNDEDALRKTIAQIIEDNPKSVEDYHNGKEKAIGFLVGQTMKAMKGKANPGMVNQILKELL